MDDIKKILTYINYPMTDELNFDGRSSARDYIEANKGKFSFDFKLFTLKEELDPKVGVLDSLIVFDDNNNVLGMNLLLPDLDKEFLKDDPSTKSGTKVILDDPAQQAIANEYVKEAGPFGSIFTRNREVRIRTLDDWGDGFYGASRDNGTRVHRGIDIISIAGEPIFSPISGRISKIGNVYTTEKIEKNRRESGGAVDLSPFKTLHIDGTDEWEGIQVVMMYVQSILPLGATVFKGGSQIAVDQGIATNGYNRAPSVTSGNKGEMTNHVHFEVRYDGQKVNPTPFFG